MSSSNGRMRFWRRPRTGYGKYDARSVELDGPPPISSSPDSTTSDDDYSFGSASRLLISFHSSPPLAMLMTEDCARVIVTLEMFDRNDVHLKGSVKGDLKG
jgi:hypothetical protein